MKALKILNNIKEWEILFGTALNASMNLSDLSDPAAARRNLGLYDEFMTKDEMKKGTLINSIHHTAIIQDPSARFVNDRQVKFWNEKLNEPMSGIANFSGNSKETFVPVTITNPLDTTKNEIIPAKYVTFNVEENTLGTLGDTWIYYKHDEISGTSSKRGIYVGNTGSFTGRFRWYAFFTVKEQS